MYIEITNNYFLKYVLNIASNVKGLSEYSQKWIVKHSEQFAKEIQQTTQRLIESGDYDNAFLVSRARTISRTEINALCECATLEGYYQSGYTKKMWVSFKDNKVRDTHKVADGQVRSLFEPFDIGNSQLMFPQDSSLGASTKEIVNCRCVMQPVK
nr:phage minor head protein [Ruminococcus bicirculans (ex Wegman et al. 2014)]